MRSLALLLCPCAVAVVVHLWLLANRASFFLDLQDSDQQARSPEVLVGVLSARHHHALRDAIRDTWLGYLRDHPQFRQRVQVKFIVGRHGCAIPEEDLEDPYSCTLLNITEPADCQEVEVLTVQHRSALGPSEVSVLSLDFKVLHPLVVTRLGVFPDGPAQELHGNITVKLFQVDQEEPVVTARFSAISTGTNVNGVWYKPVEQFILPRGFEGSLVWESLDTASLTTVDISRVQLNTGDVEALSEMLRGRPTRRERHMARLAEEGEELERESHRHGDIVFVDVVDTYRSVPSKLLQFYKWSVRRADFSLFLKTDDDCYIDVDAVLMKIDRKQLKRNNFWWGNFRQSWAVDRVGKWQELEYASPAYPAFACGSGYVVSRDLVQWLADNGDKLKAYQGEDVSMGIWMAAVGPQKYQDPGWLCEKDCQRNMLSSPQHSAEELRSMWAWRTACGDACGCPRARR